MNGRPREEAYMIIPNCIVRVAVLFPMAMLAISILPRLLAAQSQQPGSALRDTMLAPTLAAPLPDTLKMQGRNLMVFRAPILGYAPQQRMLDARDRLKRIIASGKTDSVTSRLIPQGMLISVNEQGVFVIAPGDLDELSGETMEAASERARQILKQALGEERAHRSLVYRIRAVLLTALATALFWLLLKLIMRGHRYLSGRIKKVVDARVTKVATEHLGVLSASRTFKYLQRSLNALAWILGLLAAYLWLTFSLRRFPLTRPWGDAMREHFLALLEHFALALVRTIPDVIALALIIVFTRLAIRLLNAFFTAIEARRINLPWLHVETLQPTRRIVVALFWVLALVVAYPYLPGSHTEAFKGISVFIGLVLSLGSTGIMNQVMSGLMLMYSRAFRVGDYVHIGDTEGTVTALGMLSTKIRTNKREEVTVPNSVIVGTTVKKFSRFADQQGVISYTSVTIGYATPWRQVHALLIMAAERTPSLRREPPPFVLQTALSEFYVEYQLNAYLEAPETRVKTLSVLHANIQDVFNEHGVQIMSPHYEADPPAPIWVPKEKWFEAPASISK